MTDKTSPAFLAGKEILRLLRIDAKFPRQTLLRLRRDGLPSVKVLGRFLYPRDAVIEFLKNLSRANE